MTILVAVMFGSLHWAPESVGLWGPIAYFALLIGLRTLVPRDHRRGIRHVRRGQYELARNCFLESYAFFTRHAWIDRYRAIALLSPSYMSYREMALCNAAFCSMQAGDGKRGEQLYRQALEEFPDSGTASAALNMIESARHTGDEASGPDS